MNCDLAMKQVQMALDDAAGFALLPATAEHIANCTQCSAQLTQLREIHAALGRMPERPDSRPSAGFHTRLMQQIVREPAHSQWLERRNAVKVAFIGIAAVLLTFAGLQMMQKTHPGEHTRQLENTTRVSQIEDTNRDTADALVSGIEELRDARLPTPARIYASAAPNVRDFTGSFLRTTEILVDSFTPPGDN